MALLAPFNLLRRASDMAFFLTKNHLHPTGILPISKSAKGATAAHPHFVS
jgi:hypothetical protein